MGINATQTTGSLLRGASVWKDGIVAHQRVQFVAVGRQLGTLNLDVVLSRTRCHSDTTEGDAPIRQDGKRCLAMASWLGRAAAGAAVSLRFAPMARSTAEKSSIMMQNPNDGRQVLAFASATAIPTNL